MWRSEWVGPEKTPPSHHIDSPVSCEKIMTLIKIFSPPLFTISPAHLQHSLGAVHVPDLPPANVQAFTGVLRHTRRQTTVSQGSSHIHALCVISITPDLVSDWTLKRKEWGFNYPPKWQSGWVKDLWHLVFNILHLDLSPLSIYLYLSVI